MRLAEDEVHVALVIDGTVLRQGIAGSQAQEGQQQVLHHCSAADAGRVRCQAGM